jgi:hypothetical protein
MRNIRMVLLATLLALPYAATAIAQDVEEDVGVGPAVVAAPVVYGPPVCEWGYYAYYPYACAPYGYYGPEWFYGGFFIGAGPWFHRGWYGRGWGGRGWGYGGHYAYGGRGGYGGHYAYGGRGYAYHGGGASGARGYAAPRGGSAPRGGLSGGHSGGFGGGGHMGGGGHGGGGHR